MIQGFNLSKEEAKEVLKPYAQKFHDAIHDGFADYKMNDSKNSHIHDNCTKSNLIRSYVMNRIRQIVASDSNLKMKVSKRMIFVLISDKVIVRFKKLNNRFRSQNIKTAQVNKFRSRDFNFEGVNALPVDTGWRLDKFYNEIEDINFVCPNGIGNLWRIPLEDLSVQKVKQLIFPTEKDDVIEIVTLKTELKDANRKTAN